jgi:SAM-dependent methyltransferase
MSYRARHLYSLETTAATYDAARFTSWRGRMVDRLEKATLLRALSTVPPGGRVLDMPIGTGRMARLLASRGYDVVGADLSAAMLARAQDRLDGAPLVQGDAERMPFATGAFDAVVAVRFMFHLPPAVRPRVLAEFARVSRGLVVVTYANAWTLSSVIRRVRAGRGPRHIYPAHRAQIMREAEQAGLRPVDDWPLFPGCASAHFFAFRPATELAQRPAREPARRLTMQLAPVRGGVIA